MAKKRYDLKPPFWERQKGEKAYMYAAFNVYLKMLKARSIAETLAEVNQAEQANYTSDDLKNWSQRWSWARRAEAWDNYLVKAELKEAKRLNKVHAIKWGRRVDEFRETKWGAGRSLLDKALELLGRNKAGLKDPDGKWDYELILKMVDSAFRVQSEALEYRSADAKEEKPPTIDQALTFKEYIEAVFPSFQWYWHAESMVKVLQRVADRKAHRVIFTMPPRHGKSEIISRAFTSYWVHRYPSQKVGIVSYSAELASDLSRSSKDYYVDFGGELRQDSKAVKRWSTKEGGGVIAAGARGPITGRGFHLGVIDDIVKNSDEAASPTYQKRNNEWYASTFFTRLEPNSALVIVGTRWNEGDLIGNLIRAEGQRQPDGTWAISQDAENWHFVGLEALRVKDKVHHYDLPPNITIEPDNRSEGEALCPERYDREYLLSLQRKNPYFFEALYQGKPSPLEGNLFKRADIAIVDELPSGKLQFVRYWDKAATDGGGAYTAGVLMARHSASGNFYIAGVERGQWDIPKRNAIILATARSDKQTYKKVKTWGEQEPGASGKDAGLSFLNLLKEYKPVGIDTPSGSKLARAIPLISIIGAGRLFLVDGDWNKPLLDELAAFPNGKYKDQVDAASGAFNRLQATLKPARVGFDDRYGVLF